MTVICARLNVLPCYLNGCFCVGVHAHAEAACGHVCAYVCVCVSTICARLTMGSGPRR